VQSPTELLSILRRVQSLRFDARSEAATGWDGTGLGTVAVSEPATDVVVFEEAGMWQPDAEGRPPIAFTNVFRWSAVGTALRLEHLRFGVDHPVLLFDMAPDNGMWREVSPHQCRDDCYTASLKTLDGQLVVAWSIVGPKKSESIRYTYW
jgi:hypothetical protein